jgi:hypothetical protein
MPEDLSLAMRDVWFRLMAAPMRTLGGFQRQERLWAGKAVSPEQCGNHQRRHKKIGEWPHPKLYFTEFAAIRNRISDYFTR